MLDCIQVIKYQYGKCFNCLSNYEYLKPNKHSIKTSALKHFMVRSLVIILYSANLHMTNLHTDEMGFFFAIWRKLRLRKIKQFTVAHQFHTLKTRHVFVKHGCPRRQQSQNMAKISKSYILTPPDPQGHGMSVKCEEPKDELTVQVWLLYHHPNLKYCTLFVSGDGIADRRTDRQTKGRTEDPISRCPRRTFQAGGKKKNPILTRWTILVLFGGSNYLNL